jgi:hypothetical protein
MIRARPFFIPVLILCAAETGLGAAPPRCQCWIIIDFDAVFCAPCLDPLLAFCRALPESIQDGRVLGIVVYRAPSDPKEAGKRRKIVEAKWDGFHKANGFHFPAVVDDGPVFRRWLAKGAAKVLFFDGLARAIREFELPLRPERFDEMLSLLLN